MSTVISKDGTKIGFDKVGSGPTVILVNGAMQYRKHDPVLKRVAELLSTNFTVYNYDRRGRGESGDTLPFEKQREIEDLEALIKDGGGSAMVLAFSSGSALALDAVQSGLSITKLALYEPPFIVNDSRSPLPADYVDHLNQLISEGRRGDAVKYFLTTAVGIPTEYLGGMEQDENWPWMLEIAHTIAYDGAFVADLMRGKPLPTTRWTNVTLPMLVMDGSKSMPGWMSGAADALAALLPNVERRTLPDQDHSVDPEVLAPELDNFFSK